MFIRICPATIVLVICYFARNILVYINLISTVIVIGRNTQCHTPFCVIIGIILECFPVFSTAYVGISVNFRECSVSRIGKMVFPFSRISPRTEGTCLFGKYIHHCGDITTVEGVTTLGIIHICCSVFSRCITVAG